MSTKLKDKLLLPFKEEKMKPMFFGMQSWYPQTKTIAKPKLKQYNSLAQPITIDLPQ